MLEQQQLSLKQEKLFQNKAQFIPEALLVLLIFLIVFVGFYTLLYSYLRSIKSEINRITANFLAQEGLELIRALRNYRYAINNCRETRDRNGQYQFCTEPEYTSSTWLGDLGNNNASTTSLCLDYSYTTSSCDNFDSQSATIYLNNDGFFSIKPVGTSTKFKRIIEISNPDRSAIENATSIKVISKVKWDDKEIELKGIMYNVSKFEKR